MPTSVESDQLLLKIVHDARSFLRKSLTRTQMLKRDSGSSLSVDGNKLLAEVLEAHRGLEEFLTRVSEYGQAGGDLEQSDAQAPAHHQIQAAIRRAMPLAGECEIRLESGGERSDAWLPTQFQKAVGELLDNALKFRQPGPGVIQVVVYPSPQELVLEVQDDGIGIEPQYYATIFHPLTKLHPRAQYPGAGLGLAIASKIIGAMNGTISVNSAGPKGCSFRIVVPTKLNQAS